MDVVGLAVREARRQMAEHLRTAAVESGDFIDRYARQYVSGRSTYPHPSLAMHSKLRALARELVADELVVHTTRGRRA